MTGSDRKSDHKADAFQIGVSLFDPRRGDAEDDASSPKQRSLLAIAGALLAEISLPKLVFAWMFSILLPAVLLGLAPLVATAWIQKVSKTVAEVTGLGAMLILLIVIGLGIIGWRPLLRTVENNFWSLNALAVQPGYAFCREALRYLAERAIGKDFGVVTRARLGAISSAGAGIILCICGGLIAIAVWPTSHWVATAADLLSLHRLILPTLANAIVVVSAYFAGASLAWGLADASMEQPVDLAMFDAVPGRSTWRVAHLSDIHQVGEQYGFRIESGRSGPRGNDRFTRVMDRIEAIHTVSPLDVVLVSGDMTDAGRGTEWAEFLDVVARHPVLAERMIILPGNHDLNIVDRLNPARLDLPFSPSKRLRQMRALSAIAVVQGHRVLVVDPISGKLERTLAETLAPHRQWIADFADSGSLRLSMGLGRLWDDQFPMVLPPATADGLGVVVLNSNAETHFSFTNALGMVSVEQIRRLVTAIDGFPHAHWIIALHHHLIEYPMSLAALSERVGTALINGSWFVRKLRTIATQAIVMHGHRHIDWIGQCGKLKIISAPSPVMGAKNEASTYFHIHTLTSGSSGELCLLPPERVEITGVNDPG
ncbi:MAG: metallophosphoesterase family protein [Xanthobacteraceae bacterium]